VTEGKHKPPRRTIKLPRAEYLIAVTLVFVVLLLGWLSVKVVSQDRDLRTSNDARDALARQVQSLGEKPVAGPPGSRGEPGKATVGAPGPSGPPGPSGAAGKDAPTITPSPGPSGPVGPAGVKGADSTVPGPTGPAGQNGADGAAGTNGKDGTNGQNGAPPSEWTYTDQYGNEYRCVPVDGFDPDNPRYRCTQTSTANPEPTSSPSPSPSQQPSPSDSSSGLLPLNLLSRRS
jgi:hypothetical protein